MRVGRTEAGILAGTLLASLAFSLVFLSLRNLYDDEVGSFELFLETLPTLWARANAGDVHPPGQYALGHLFLGLAGTPRWAGLGPLLICMLGIAIFVGTLLAGGVLRGAPALLFAGVAFLHPQILMWGSSLRWQPYLAGGVLAVLAVALSLHREPEDGRLRPPSIAVCVGLGLLLGALLYVNYLILFLSPALAVAWLLRYPIDRGSVVRIAVIGLVAGLLFAPQVAPLWTVHLPQGGGQRSILLALVKLPPGAVAGQAVLPWHPVALPVGLVSLFFFARLVGRVRVAVREAGGAVRLVGRANPAWLVLLGFYVLVFAGAVVTGVGYKPRSLLFLGPIYAYLLAVAWAATSWRPVKLVGGALLVVWLGASGHNLLAKTGTSKAGFIDRHDEVIALAHEEAHGRRALFLSHDPALAFALHRAARERGEDWAVCAPIPDVYHGDPCQQARAWKGPERVFLVNSFIGSYLSVARALDRAQQGVMAGLRVERIVERSLDPDAAMKRRIPTADAALSHDFRYQIAVGSLRPGASWHSMIRAYRTLLRREATSGGPEL